MCFLLLDGVRIKVRMEAFISFHEVIMETRSLQSKKGSHEVFRLQSVTASFN